MIRIRLGLAVVAVIAAQGGFAGTLQQVYQQALASDPQLKAAQAVFRADRELMIQSRSALLPDLSVSAFTRYSDINSDVDRAGNSNGYQLSLTQPLFRAEQWFDFKAGQALAQRAEVEFNRSQQLLIRRTVEAYLDVLQAQTGFTTSQTVEAAVKRRLDQVQAQFDVGLIAVTDVEEAQAGYDSARVSRILAQGQLDKSFESIVRLTGQDWQALGGLSNEFPVEIMQPTAFQPWVDKALAGNLALQLAELDVQSSDQSLKARRSRHLPTVDLVAGYGSDRGLGASTLGDEQDTSYLGLNLNLPLYQGGRDASRSRETASRLDAAIQLREDVRRSVIQSSRSLFRDLMTDVESVAARKQSIVSTETALKAVSAGYSVGTRNIVDVLQAERALYSAIQEYQVARYSYVRNRLRFEESLGTLSPDVIEQLDRWMVAPGSEPSLYQKQVSGI